jgi:hypothetical protein
MPFSSKDFSRSAGATFNREHMSAKALSTKASDSKPALSAELSPIFGDGAAGQAAAVMG